MLTNNSDVYCTSAEMAKLIAAFEKITSLECVDDNVVINGTHKMAVETLKKELEQEKVDIAKFSSTTVVEPAVEELKVKIAKLQKRVFKGYVKNGEFEKLADMYKNDECTKEELMKAIEKTKDYGAYSITSIARVMPLEIVSEICANASVVDLKNVARVRIEVVKDKFTVDEVARMLMRETDNTTMNQYVVSNADKLSDSMLVNLVCHYPGNFNVSIYKQLKERNLMVKDKIFLHSVEDSVHPEEAYRNALKAFNA